MEDKINNQNTTTTSKTNNLSGFFRVANLVISKIDQKLISTPLKNIPIVQRRIFIIFSIFFFGLMGFIVVLGILAQIITTGNSADEGNEIIPSEVENITPPPGGIRNPSVYADDFEVLLLEQKVNELLNTINTSRIDEPQIYPPSLDYDVDFD